MNYSDQNRHRSVLIKIARKALTDREFLPDFSARALQELTGINNPASSVNGAQRDLRNLLWCSIDNDDSLDLDQLTFAEALPAGVVKILIAIADVDALVKKQSALDDHARQNTTSIYTAGGIFPMLPEKLSTDLTSLKYDADRRALIIEITVATDGTAQNSDIYTALVRNRAKLAYNSVGAWLENTGPMPKAVASVPGLDANLHLQDQVAQKLKARRQEHGALHLQTTEARAVFDNDVLVDLQTETTNRAKELIENFMVLANGVTARYLTGKKFPTLRRVVRIPKDWDRIVELAHEQGFDLPKTPDSKALDGFLLFAEAKDKVRFPDISLSVVKLLGSGEYVVNLPGEAPIGHFGLAVKDYSHSTAPNRRYPDVITLRLLKATLSDLPVPYTNNELKALATHCTEKEDDAKKVERQIRKSAEAMLLEHQIGKQFDAIVTGASAKGTWVRLLHPPVEGKLVQGFNGMKVGQQVRVQLIHTEVERGFIDFKKV